jgi:hypothetical protein
MPSLRLVSTQLQRCDSKSEVSLRPTVGHPILLPIPFWGPRPNFCCCQTFTVSSIWGALFDERPDLSFVAVMVSNTCRDCRPRRSWWWLRWVGDRCKYVWHSLCLDVYRNVRNAARIMTAVCQHYVARSECSALKWKRCRRNTQLVSARSMRVPLTVFLRTGMPQAAWLHKWKRSLTMNTCWKLQIVDTFLVSSGATPVANGSASLFVIRL